jgi:general nucleoside transport system ATP-binding protein
VIHERAPDARDRVVLALHGITKRFGTAVALDSASLDVRAGSIHALLGENGAGKTTLMRIAFGMIRPDAGTISTQAAKPIDSPAAAIAAGIGMVHQHFTNVPAMTVAENVALGHRGLYDARRAAERVVDIGRRLGLELDPYAPVEDLPVGAQQRLEIVKALGMGARLLILDEPTAVLAPAEAEELMKWLRAFADDGNAVVLITHKLSEALRIADDVTVLRRGIVTLSTTAATATLEQVADAMLGETLHDDVRHDSPRDVGESVARLRSVTVRDERGIVRLREVSLDVNAGEILGIAAIEGSGQRELLRVLARRATPSEGAVEVPNDVAFVPEDRHADALVLEFNAAENVALKNAGAKRGRIPWRALREHTRQLVAAFDVRGADDAAPVRSLSGGNQQKLVLARELDGAPAFVVAENPTRGLDVRAARAVRARLRDAADAGAGVVVYSSDLDEVLALATRVVVLHGGELLDVGRERESVGRAMLGLR